MALIASWQGLREVVALMGSWQGKREAGGTDGKLAGCKGG